MKYLILLILTICCFCSLKAQTPVFKNSVSGSLGARVYDSDLGLGAGFDAGIELNVYNIAPEHSPIVFSINPYFNNFNAENEEGIKANREFLGFAGGLGLHFDEKVFALVNVGHLFLLNSNTDRSDLENTGITYASFKGSYVFDAVSEVEISFFLSGEVGYTFSDIESLDRGKGDQFEGSTFLSIKGGIIKFF